MFRINCTLCAFLSGSQKLLFLCCHTAFCCSTCVSNWGLLLLEDSSWIAWFNHNQRDTERLLAGITAAAYSLLQKQIKWDIMALVHVNMAFVHVNMAFVHVNMAFIHVNMAFVQVNMAFVHVNDITTNWSRQQKIMIGYGIWELYLISSIIH
jgi:hypothetical protein